MSDELQTEVDRLISIAQLHAWNALARPPAQRDAHLAHCRDFWKHYAAAFTTSDAQTDEFADALDRATRDLMVEIRRNIAVIHQAGGFRMLEDSGQLNTGRPEPGKTKALTLDELRPIFRQIIGQS
jgi:hypothetical protein